MVSSITISRPDEAPDVIEEARRLKSLIEHFGTQERVAKKYRLKRSSIAQKVRLLALPAKVQSQIKSGLLTANHGRALLRIPEKYRDVEAHKLLDREMTGNRAHQWAKERARELQEQEKSFGIPFSQQMEPDWFHLQEIIRQSTGCRVRLEPTGGGGAKLYLQAFTQHQLEELVKKLRGEIT